jgi:YidC/Oxa1 family membrane protein insertase
MDRKSILIIAVAFVLMLVVNKLANNAFPPKPLPPGMTNVVSTTTSTNVAVVAAPVPTNATVTAPAPTLAVPADVKETTIVLTNENARYTFTSHGGGLKTVELLHYPESVSVTRKTIVDTHHLATLNAESPVPTLAILGGAAIQGDDVYTLTPTTGGVRAEKILTNGLHVVKEFQLTNNYLINATVRLENTSGQPLALPEQEWVVGTATPMNALDNGAMTVGTMWYDGAKADDKYDTYFANRSGCTQGIPRSEFRGGASNVVWAAAHNQFFVLAAIPRNAALQVVVRKVNLPAPSEEEITNDLLTVRAPVGFETALVYPACTLTTNLERQITIYAGPKEYRTLARIAGKFNNNLDKLMGFGFFGFFSKALLLSMNWLHNALWIPYGWAIVVITIIIKLLFWPLTQASTRSMKRMQALQPQMKAIAEKYKDDPAKKNQKTMEFMKENKVNPMSGCLPMLIQMPVFIGFFYMLRTAIELRGAGFLWNHDLSQPDTLFMIPGVTFIPFISTPAGLPFNLLPLIMGGVMLWQAHLTPASPGVDPGQQKIMRYLPLIFLLFLYNYSAGLALYWTVQNLLTVLQTKLTANVPVPAPPSALTPLQKKSK